MRATTLAAIAAAIALIDEKLPELRERCSEATVQKFTASRLDLQTAHDEEGLTTDSEPGPTQASVNAAAIADELAARGFTATSIATEVREHLTLDVSAATADALASHEATYHPAA